MSVFFHPYICAKTSPGHQNSEQTPKPQNETNSKSCGLYTPVGLGYNDVLSPRPEEFYDSTTSNDFLHFPQCKAKI